MSTLTAFAFRPEAIRIEAQTCLASCGVIRSSTALRQAVSARR